jgi:nitric oxide reductase subunit C
MTNRILFFSFVVLFLVYSGLVYTVGTEIPENLQHNELALEGKRLWQAHNCSACHQIYGLGGYLGPELTNVISAKGKGPDYARAMINNGVRQMPRFDFSPTQLDALIAFLTTIDATGISPNPDVKLEWHGSYDLTPRSK